MSRFHQFESKSTTAKRETGSKGGEPRVRQEHDLKSDYAPLTKVPPYLQKDLSDIPAYPPVHESGAVQAKVKQASKPKSSSASGMPEPVLNKMEKAFQTDFSGVKINPSSTKASQLGALAYTQGQEIHFAPGVYQPGSQRGQELLGHELTHVVQQREGRVKPTGTANGLPLNDDPSLEKEADALGQKAARS